MKEYISDLFADNRGDRATIRKTGGNDIVIMEEDVKKAMNSMANGKAAGPDGIIVKTLEAPDDFWC